MIRVFFKKNRHTQWIADFDNLTFDNIYTTCLPLLEAQCTSLGFDEIITMEDEIVYAKFWAIGCGLDCHGHNTGHVVCFDNEEDANTYVDKNNEYSDGIVYSVTSDIEVMIDYCDSFSLDHTKYMRYIKR